MGGGGGFALLGPVVNEDATGEDLLSFRGLPATQNSTTVDGASEDRSFSAVPRGAGGDAGLATEDEVEGGFSSATGQGRASELGRGGGWGRGFVFAGGGAGVSGERAELLGGVWARGGWGDQHGVEEWDE